MSGIFKYSKNLKQHAFNRFNNFADALLVSVYENILGIYNILNLL